MEYKKPNMDYKSPSQQSQPIAPRLIIHGGAGNILPANLPPAQYTAYHDALLHILCTTHHYLTTPSSTYSSFFPSPDPSSALSDYPSALDAVTHAVTQLENSPLFNSGHGAVFTRDGINECEASVMVSSGKKKRGFGVMGLQHVKNPIKLAREMLIHGEKDLEGGNGEHRGPMSAEEQAKRSLGAQGHSQLHRFSAEKLAEEWGLEMVEPSYFFVQKRWDEHISGLRKEREGRGQASWDIEEFIPQGTCGAVALDAYGVTAVATSTGGMTNKLTGRIGDTPTLGAGFWAEEWEEKDNGVEAYLRRPGPVLELSGALKGLLSDCFPSLGLYAPVPRDEREEKVYRATAMSGTGNGDSFLRMNAVRTASAIARYRGSSTSLQAAITEVAGPGGELVQSAGDRWKKTGEGEAGIIGIELRTTRDGEGNVIRAKSEIVDDYNCGGMFRAAVDENGKAVMRVWRKGQYGGLEAYEALGEGRGYDVREWCGEKGMGKEGI